MASEAGMRWAVRASMKRAGMATDQEQLQSDAELFDAAIAEAEAGISDLRVQIDAIAAGEQQRIDAAVSEERKRCALWLAPNFPKQARDMMRELDLDKRMTVNGDGLHEAGDA